MLGLDGVDETIEVLELELGTYDELIIGLCLDPQGIGLAVIVDGDLDTEDVELLDPQLLDLGCKGLLDIGTALDIDVGDTNPASIIEEELILQCDDVIALDGRLGDLRHIAITEDDGDLEQLGDLHVLRCDPSTVVAPECSIDVILTHPAFEDLVFSLLAAIGAWEEQRVRHLSLYHVNH